MQAKDISISLGGTLNLGNYESARFDATITATLDEGEDVVQAAQSLTDIVRGILTENVEPVLADLPPSTRDGVLRRFGWQASDPNAE